MKFLTKINRNYLLILSITLIIISIIGYFILKKVILEEAKEKLIENEFLLKEQLSNNSIIPNIYPIIEIKKIKKTFKENSQFNIIYIENELDDNELETYIEYSNIIEVNNLYYSLKLRQSILENEDLLLTISIPLLFVLFFAFIFTYFLNKKLNNTLWSKFEYNLKQLENYRFKNQKKLNLITTDIIEFDNLNLILNSLTEKLSSDYQSLKEFSENASHETQTPLAIILMNLEDVLQEDLPKKTSDRIYTSFQYATKLQKLNKSLLLLSKIENQQFNNSEIINLSKIIKNKLTLFQPLIDSSDIELKSNLDDDFLVNMDPVLADVLINNLLSNAINHNIDDGFISISIKKNKLSISNSSKNLKLNEDELFERFKKGNVYSESIGLGLSIVKKIIYLTKLNIYLKHNKNSMLVTLVK